MKLSAQLITVTYPVADPAKAASFYSALLGIEFARSLTHQVEAMQAPVGSGVKLLLSRPHASERNAICHFAVDKLDTAVAELERHGAKKVGGPYDMPLAPEAIEQFKDKYHKAGGKEQVTGSLGKGVLLLDPDGNLVGLVQLEAFAHDAFSSGDVTDKELAEQLHSIALGRTIRSARP